MLSAPTALEICKDLNYSNMSSKLRVISEIVVNGMDASSKFGKEVEVSVKTE